MNFEWDEDKNQENIRKHGLDFADAWEIFEAPVQTARDTRADYGKTVGLESDFSAIGLWSWSSLNAAKTLQELYLCERH